MTNNYAKTCKEVFEVLRLTPNEQLKLIPLDVLNQLKNNANKCNERIKIEFDIMGEPRISHEAQVMILAIYRKYFLDNQERDCLNKRLQENDEILEEIKVQKYKNSGDIFYKNISQERNQNSNSDSNRIITNEIIIENEEQTDFDQSLLILSNNIFLKFIKDIMNKIKNIFKK